MKNFELTVLIFPLLLALTGVGCSQADSQEYEERRTKRKQLEARIMSNGVQVGDQVPAVQIHELDGKEINLASLWADKPVVIIAGSMTCGISRKRCANHKFKNFPVPPSVSMVMLYTIEAHPDGKGYRQPPSPDRPRTMRSQPETLDERLKLATEMSGVVTALPIVVDNMDNDGWKIMGSGPNVAVLVDTDGKGLLKQPFFDVEAMSDFIKERFKP